MRRSFPPRRRSETSILRTTGRAARREEGRVILYADVMTHSLMRALATSKLRRERQEAHNRDHGITPRSVKRGEQSALLTNDEEDLTLMVAERRAHKDRRHGVGQIQIRAPEKEVTPRARGGLGGNPTRGIS